MKMTSWLLIALSLTFAAPSRAAEPASPQPEAPAPGATSDLSPVPEGAKARPSGEAAQPRKSFLRAWFENLKKGLAESAVQGNYQRARVTAVAAVRGAAQDSQDPDKPSWKGGPKARRAAQARKERKEFAKAVDLILAGKTREGSEALDAFEKAHPKSALLAEVREARRKAGELQAEAEGAAPAPAQAAPAPDSGEKR